MQFVELEDVIREVSTSKEDYCLTVNQCNKGKEIRVLDTRTGKVKKITLTDLYNKPIKPFYKTEKGLKLGSSHKLKELMNKPLRILDLAFYVTPEYYLIYYKNNVYYKADIVDKEQTVSGFCYYPLGVSFFTEPSERGGLADRGQYFLKRPYFVYEDLNYAFLVDKNISMQSFLERATTPAFYTAKVKMIYG